MRSGGNQYPSSSSSLIPSLRSTASRSMGVPVSRPTAANEARMAGRELISVMSRSNPTGPRPLSPMITDSTSWTGRDRPAAEHLPAAVECLAHCPASPGYCAVMTWEKLLAYCLAKPGAWQDEPWEGDVVAKVGGKIFAFLGSGDTPSVGLKCGASREAADEWLARYPDDASVMAYIGRSGWNTLRTGGAIPDDELLEAIDASYSAIVSKLPKKDRP